MYAVIEYPIALLVAAAVVYVLSSKLGDRASRQCGRLDREGNSAGAHGRAIKQSVLLATGIAGAIKLPAILAGIAKIIAAAASG